MKKKFFRVDGTPALADVFMTRMLTRDLFAVFDLLVSMLSTNYRVTLNK